MEHATLYDVLTAWAPTVGFIVTALLAYWGKTKITKVESTVAEIHTIADKTHAGLAAIEKATNGMQEKLVKATEQAALAAGLAQGKALEKARADAETLAKMHKDP